MLRFYAAEDDSDDELVEEHVTKVCETYGMFCTAKTVTENNESQTLHGSEAISTHHVLRFTTAAALTPSWPSLFTSFRRVLSARTSVWSLWAHGRFVHARMHSQSRGYILVDLVKSCQLCTLV